MTQNDAGCSTRSRELEFHTHLSWAAQCRAITRTMGWVGFPAPAAWVCVQFWDTHDSTYPLHLRKQELLLHCPLASKAKCKRTIEPSPPPVHLATSPRLRHQLRSRPLGPFSNRAGSRCTQLAVAGRPEDTHAPGMSNPAPTSRWMSKGSLPNRSKTVNQSLGTAPNAPSIDPPQKKDMHIYIYRERER